MANRQQLTKEDYEKILYFISLIEGKKEDYRRTVLKNLSDLFNYNYLTFFLADLSGNCTSPIGFNIDDHMLRLYTTKYYKEDIFHPVNIPNNLLSKKTISVTDIMPYDNYENTEFYNGFLKNTNLYYEIALPLKKSNGIIGYIGILRPKEAPAFTIRDVEIIDRLSVHIANNLHDHLVTLQTEQEMQIYDNCICLLPIGLVLLNSRLQVIRFNDTAKTYCNDIMDDKLCFDPVSEVINTVLANTSLQGMVAGSSIISTIDSYAFKMIPSIVPSLYNDIETYYLVYILNKDNDNGASQKIDLKDVATRYKLTDRELEIIGLILQGMHNKEIADDLYISCHTVRTHINNILTKMNVNNRTAIISKILGII